MVPNQFACAESLACGVLSKDRETGPEDLLVLGKMLLDPQDQTPYSLTPPGTTAEYHPEDTHLGLDIIRKVKLREADILTPILDIIPEHSKGVLVNFTTLVFNSGSRVIVVQEGLSMNDMWPVALLPDGMNIPRPNERRNVSLKNGHVNRQQSNLVGNGTLAKQTLISEVGKVVLLTK
jgi:hypothetical protein